MGARVRAPMPLHGVIDRNFIHRATCILDGISTVTPARTNAWRRRSRRALGRLSSSPNFMKGSAAACRIWPGAAIKLTRPQTPPTTDATPNTAANCSGASTPFWSGTTQVAGPTSGRMASATSGTCQAFTVTRTVSTTPTCRGSSVACTGWMTKSPEHAVHAQPLGL